MTPHRFTPRFMLAACTAAGLASVTADAAFAQGKGKGGPPDARGLERAIERADPEAQDELQRNLERKRGREAGKAERKSGKEAREEAEETGEQAAPRGRPNRAGGGGNRGPRR